MFQFEDYSPEKGIQLINYQICTDEISTFFNLLESNTGAPKLFRLTERFGLKKRVSQDKIKKFLQR
jgi:hypothetical protein